MDALTENLSLAWLCLTVLLAFGELLFARYYAVLCSVGASLGLLLSFFPIPLWVQGSLAGLCSAGLIWLCRGWIREVRCADAMDEMQGDEINEPNPIRLDRDLGDRGEDGASPDPMLRDGSAGDLFPQQSEGGDLREKASYPLCLLDP